ncbi:hypothetical protein [Streptomyces sp. NPDC007205]|uniref:hypothetical protein n=1 Tax=Streptomyces sp. NPDC007205 TaxID=3154316 RepID=UPI0033F4934F
MLTLPGPEQDQGLHPQTPATCHAADSPLPRVKAASHVPQQISRTADLNGLPASAIEFQLFAQWQLHSTLWPSPQQRHLVSALVYLRRTGRYCYDLSEHAHQARSETRALNADIVRHVLSTAHPVGAIVHILGEPHTGTVVHVSVGWDRPDPYPAPWYVVAVPHLQVCRAHGADEIEPATPVTGERARRPGAFSQQPLQSQGESCPAVCSSRGL